MELVDKEAKPIGGSAHVYVPKSWRGARVVAARVEDEDENEDEAATQELNKAEDAWSYTAFKEKSS